MIGSAGRMGWPAVAVPGMLTATCAGTGCHPGNRQVYCRAWLSCCPVAAAAPDSTRPVPARTAATAVILTPGRRYGQIMMMASLTRVLSCWPTAIASLVSCFGSADRCVPCPLSE